MRERLIEERQATGAVQDFTDTDSDDPSEFDRFKDLTRKLVNVPRKERRSLTRSATPASSDGATGQRVYRGSCRQGTRTHGWLEAHPAVASGSLVSSEPPQFAQVQVQVQAHWVEPDGTLAVVANQLVAQLFQGNVLLTFGQVVPPAIAGTPQQQMEQAQGMDLKIDTLARFVIAPEPFREMTKAFQQCLDAMNMQEGPQGDSGEKP